MLSSLAAGVTAERAVDVLLPHHTTQLSLSFSLLSFGQHFLQQFVMKMERERERERERALTERMSGALNEEEKRVGRDLFSELRYTSHT